MCENCGPTPPHIVEAFDEFEKSISKLREAVGDTDGLVVDWAFVCATNIIHQHTDSTATTYFCRLNQPTYRTKGLITQLLDEMKADTVCMRLAEE